MSNKLLTFKTDLFSNKIRGKVNKAVTRLPKRAAFVTGQTAVNRLSQSNVRERRPDEVKGQQSIQTLG